MRFKPYPNYKPSGVEWLGDVPAGWNILALKFVVSMESGEQITAERIDPIGDFPVYGGNGLRGFTSSFTHDGSYALIGRQGALCGNINYATGKFWASEHAVVVSPIVPCETRWIGELLRTMDLGQYSITAAQPGLSVDAISKLRIPFAPKHEQSAISIFLERETAKIDTLINRQEKLIELLKEKRQAVISHAVTKGLDPTVPMKDSGVDWLGQVPGHWDVLPMKRIASIRYGIGEPPQYQQVGTALIRATNIHAGVLFEKNMVFVDPEDIPASRIVWLSKGDIIVVRSGAYTGDSAIIPDDYGPCIAGFDMVLTCHSADSKFIQFALLSKYLKEGQIDLEKMRAAQPHLNAEELGSCLVALPPTEEQLRIIAFLGRVTIKIDTLIAKAEQAIALQKEHRTALISAAVTGKIDVRNEIIEKEVA